MTHANALRTVLCCAFCLTTSVCARVSYKSDSSRCGRRACIGRSETGRRFFVFIENCIHHRTHDVFSALSSSFDRRVLDSISSIFSAYFYRNVTRCCCRRTFVSRPVPLGLNDRNLRNVLCTSVSFSRLHGVRMLNVKRFNINRFQKRDEKKKSINCRNARYSIARNLEKLVSYDECTNDNSTRKRETGGAAIHLFNYF